MRRFLPSRRFVPAFAPHLWSGALVLLVAACGGGEAGPSANEALGVLATVDSAVELPQAATDLLPDDAFVVLRIESLDAFNGLSQDFRDLDGIHRTPVHVLKDLAGLGMTVGDHRDVDHAAPALLAVSFPKGGLVPAVTAILPQNKAGGYRAVALGEAKAGPATGRCALAAGMPGGVFSLRVDAQAALKVYRPFLEMTMQQVLQMASAMGARQTGGMDVQAIMAMYVDMARQLFDSAETLEVAVGRHDDAVALIVRLDVLADSMLAGQASAAAPLADFAGFADPEAAVSFVYGMGEVASMSEGFLSRMAATYPAGMRDAMADVMAMSERFRPLMGNAGAGNFDLDGGMRYSMTFGPADAPAYVAAYDAMLEDADALATVGMHLNHRESVADDSGTLHRYQYDFDLDVLMEQLGTLPTPGLDQSALFSEQMEIVLLPFATRLGILSGPQTVGADRIARMRAQLAAPPAVPAAYQPYLEWVGPTTPAGVMRLDMARLIGQFLGGSGFAEMFPDEGEAFRKLGRERLPLTLFFAVENQAYRGGMTLDMADLGRVVEVMQ
ncbi:MAG TPA: hypothetical protein VGC54_15120 [Planctomycetota bacterium]